MLGAEKTLVWKSGYFARAAAANADDLRLIKCCTDLAVECALRREGGVIGHDEDNGDLLRAIEFDRIDGGKPFDIDVPVVRRPARRDRPAEGREGGDRALTRAPTTRAPGAIPSRTRADDRRWRPKMADCAAER